MIASIHGVVETVAESALIIRIGGLGIRVEVPANVISEYGQIGREVSLLTYLVVREDSLTLYGFLNQTQRYIYQLLIGISGIGPRLAIAILSTLTPEMLANAVQQEEPQVISRVPGVGNKTAQKIVLELKGKLLAETTPEGIAAISSVDTDVLEVLTSMGFSIVEAQAAIQSIPRDVPDDLEERVRFALNFFSS